VTSHVGACAPSSAIREAPVSSDAARIDGTSLRAVTVPRPQSPWMGTMRLMPASKKSAKKPAARVTPKVSPLRGMSVEDWVATKTEGWQKSVVTRLVRLVKRVAPEATVAIKWGQPVFEHHGPMAFIKPAKAHVTFGFWRGAELTDAAGVLEGGERMKHVKVTSLGGLDEPALETFVREACALNASKGDPTRVTKKGA
jgi:hypothetical protein